MVVSHDGVGHGAGWFLDKIVISENGKEEKDDQDAGTQRKLEKTKKETKADKKKDGKKSKEEKKDDEKALIFYCGQWLDTEEGDGKTERELRLMGKTLLTVIWVCVIYRL